MSDYFSLPANSLTASHAYSKCQPQGLYRKDKQTNKIGLDSPSSSSFATNPRATKITSAFFERNGSSMSQGSFSSLPSVSVSAPDHSRSSPLATHYAVDSTCTCAEDLGYLTAATCPTTRPDFGGLDSNDSSNSAAGSTGCNRCTEKPHVASLERSYVTHAAVGRVECNSKGCRPILEDRWTKNSSSSESTSSWNGNASHNNVGASHGTFGLSKHQLHRRDARSHFSLEIAQLLDNIWTEKESAEKWFEAAITEAPFDVRLLSAYAKFAWKELKDMDKADCLFKRAVDEAPNDAEALAGYALFLWDHEAAN